MSMKNAMADAIKADRLKASLRFEARGAHVFQLPQEFKVADGSARVRMGFRVFSIADGIDKPEEIATIAKLMTKHAKDFE